MELLKALLETDATKLLIVAVVLIALALVFVTTKGRSARRLLSIGGAAYSEADLTQSMVKAIDERVVHKWKNVIQPDFQQLGTGIDALRAEVRRMDDTAQRRMDRLAQDIDKLDAEREENRVTVSRFEGRLENVEGTCARLESSQTTAHEKLDVLLERRRTPRG